MNVKARDGSLLAKIIGSLVILIGSILNWMGIFEGNIYDVIMVGIAISALFGTVDINLMIDKFKK